MNILHFGSSYLPDNSGNVERMRKMLENNTSMKRENVYIYTLTENDGIFSDDDYYNETGIKILRFKNLKEAKRNIKKIVKNNNINVIITHTIPTSIIACGKISRNVLIFSEFHTLIQSSFLKMTVKKIIHKYFLNKRINKYFVLSTGAKEYLSNEYNIKAEKIIFLPNGYDSSKAMDVGRQKGNSEFFTFGYVGTFYKWQGIDMIYSNLDKIMGINPDVRLFLLGSGERYEELRKLSELSKYKGRLIVSGMIPRSEVEEYMKEIDLLMIPRPSTLETETAIPLKIFEGVSYNKPLIISNVFGLKEVLNNDEAFVFDPNKANNLYEICRYAYENQHLLDIKTKKSKKKLKEWPSWNTIHKRQHDAIKTCMNGGC